MKSFKCSTWITALVVTCFFSTVFPTLTQAQTPSAVPVDLVVPIAPTPARADGKIILLYELHITNFRAKPLELKRVEILADQSTVPAAVFEGTDLAGQLGRPGAPADLADKRIIGGGLRAVEFIQLSYGSESEVPKALRHRLTFKPAEPAVAGQDTVVEGAVVMVRPPASLVISAPLRGEGWVALNGPSNTSDHRRSIVIVDGQARVAQRFAIDWTRLGADGQAFRGDPAKNANWSAYGAEVLAVADATVVEVKDGIPENDPTADKRAVPITLETVGGNHLILDLGGGFFAFYAHLQPGSLRVKLGDRVRTGQVLAKLGNSGNSDAPHLHFHITDANSPLGAEGLPYLLRSFEVLGRLPSTELLVNGKGWKPDPAAKTDNRKREIPVENLVVRFP